MREIKIQNKNGRIAIQFSVNKQRYSIYGLGNWESCSDRDKAGLLCRVIQRDILEHEFDNTLEKYKQGIGKATKSLDSAIEMFNRFIIESGIETKNYRTHYKPIQNFYRMTNSKIGDCKAVETYFNNVSALTYNMRRGVFRRFGKWLASEGYLSGNPYESLKTRKGQREKVNPFTADEVNRLIVALQSMDVIAAKYYLTCFLTGCRPSEIIGLQWNKIDRQKLTITIDTALARSDSGNSNGKRRELKSTKTGDSRTLPLTSKLTEVLSCLESYQKTHGLQSELVFCDSSGNPLNDVLMARKYWYPALEKAAIARRTPYATRHTAASILLDAGFSVADAAKLLGHKSLSMVNTTYGHSIGPTKMPSYQG